MDSKMNKRIFVGAAFLILGVLLTLDNLNIFRFELPDYFFGWYSILIIVGLFLSFAREKLGVGITLIIIGGLFFLDEMAYHYYWNFEIRDFFDLWPLILVAIGVSLIVKRSKVEEGKKDSGDDSDFVDELAVFSGSERIITSNSFKGGKLTSIFGGTMLNLNKAGLDWGTNVLDVFVMFGGCDIRVPSDMNVKVKVTAIFGGFSDERKVINDNEANEGKELIIKGLVLFGGGEVK